MKRVTPETAGCDCAACPFAKDGKPHRPVLAVGPFSSPLGVVVAESPGSEEVDRGEPLMGPTGAEFSNTLESVGLSRNKLLILHVICCRPKPSRSEKEMHDAVNCCRPYVVAVMERVPEEIPLLIAGKWAYVSITGKDKGHGNERGFVQLHIGARTAKKTHRLLKSGGVVEVSEEPNDEEFEGDS